MNKEHPINPPPELIEDWIEIAKPLPQRPPNPNELAALAARWGADQELEACCEWIYKLMDLRTSRRPKPPSLKEQALAEPEPKGPTDKDLSDLWSWAAGQDQGPWPTQQHCFARAVLSNRIRAARRPKPPSLKDEVREIIECLIEGDCVNDEDAVTLRRTLEFLPN